MRRSAFTVTLSGAVGWYTFNLKGPASSDPASGTRQPGSWMPIRVLIADFTPAPFQVTNTLNGQLYQPGDSVEVTTQAALHAGGPYANAASRVTARLFPQALEAQAYTVLARQGRYQPLTLLASDPAPRPETSVFTPAVATLIGNILADPDARMLEFGRGLQFPVETAIKTGTSTDYRDAWAIAFDYRHTIGVWMGNLDGSAMDGVTGAVGPAMVQRSLFSELNRNQDTGPLALSRDLVLAKICREDGRLADESCESTTEWFVPGTLPPPTGTLKVAAAPQYRLLQPTAGLHIAHDPRIPAEFEALPMQIAAVTGLLRVDWYVDGKLAASTTDTHFPWPLQRGTHSVNAQVFTDSATGAQGTDDIRFYVH
jgi:penicillin-binding protein 1C